MATILKTYFPTIRTRKEVLEEISESEKLSEMFRQWNEGQQEEFLDVCTGNSAICLYVYIPLDVFQNVVQNKGIGNRLEAWLEFFSTDEPRRIAELLKEYPEFKQMYQEIYELCQNVEKVMEMFSKELQELDRNTVQYMIDVMQEEIDGLKGSLQEKEVSLKEQEAENQRLLEQIKKLEEELAKEK